MTIRPPTEFNLAERSRIGAQVRDARTAIGMTQRDLADVAGCRQDLVSCVEASRRDVSLSSLIDLSAAAGRSVEVVAAWQLPLLDLTADEVDAIRDALTALVNTDTMIGPLVASALDKLTTTEETRTDG